MWKLKDFAEGNSKGENAKLMKERLEHLQLVIPEIKRVEVGINLPSSEYSNFDVVLDMYFESYEDMVTYQIHPEHEQVSAWIGNVREHRCAVDYEV
jgi:Stress responsive A/B Barrel Domain.